jgi:hypothetical protein
MAAVATHPLCVRQQASLLWPSVRAAKNFSTDVMPTPRLSTQVLVGCRNSGDARPSGSLIRGRASRAVDSTDESDARRGWPTRSCRAKAVVCCCHFLRCCVRTRNLLDRAPGELPSFLRSCARYCKEHMYSCDVLWRTTLFAARSTPAWGCSFEALAIKAKHRRTHARSDARSGETVSVYSGRHVLVG